MNRTQTIHFSPTGRASKTWDYVARPNHRRSGSGFRGISFGFHRGLEPRLVAAPRKMLQTFGMRFRISLRLSSAVLVTTMLSFGAGAGSRPATCDAQHAGKIRQMPAVHGDNQEASMTRGLEVCAHGTYHYRWEGLTVSYSELLRSARMKDRSNRHDGMVPRDYQPRS